MKSSCTRSSDLFEDDLLFPLDVVLTESGPTDDVRQHVDGERQVLIEHFDVVAGVLLGGERVHLPADRIDRLSDILGTPRRRALEEHVLHKMRDAALRLRLVT